MTTGGALEAKRSGSAARQVPAWWWGATAAVGALPTLVSAAWSPTLLVDDWGFAAAARRDGFVALMEGIDQKSRPLQALYHAVTFSIAGDHVVPHLLLLALLNALVAVLVLLVASSCLSPRLAFLVTACWVVLANHGATRLWISAAPISVSLALLLLAAWFALRENPRLVPVVVFGALSALSYEGGVALAMALAVVASWRGSDRAAVRLRDAVLGVGAIGAVAVWVLVFTPKQLSGSAPFEPGRVLSSGIGSALLPVALRPLSILLLLAVAVTLVTAAMPSFRRPGSVVAAVGLAVIVLGAGPFVFARFPLSTDGMLDRVNVYLALGTALLLAGTLDQLWRLPKQAAMALTTAILLLLAAGNLQDVKDAHQAQAEGRTALAALQQWLDAHPDGTDAGPVVIAPMPGAGGWSAYGYDSIASAVYLRTGRTYDLHDSLEVEEFARAAGLHLVLQDGEYVVVACDQSTSC